MLLNTQGTVTVLLLSILGFAGCGASTDDEQLPPDIVLIIADDLSWEHLGAYGSTEVRTPHIDRLAAEGVVFSHAFVSSPSCTPSRAALLTGRNGFELRQGASLWGYLPADYPVYPDLLEAEGYVVGATGKGWGPGFLMERERNPAGRLHSELEYDPYDHLFERTEVSRVDYAANLGAFLDRLDGEPFAFWVGTYEPHRGYTPGLAASQGRSNLESLTVPPFLPDTLPVRGDLNEYLFEVEHIDAQVGRLIVELETHDRLDNTVILFTSDNGMPFPRAKATLYDYGTRMPLIVWWGDRLAGGRTVDDMISLTDIAPSLLEIAGIPVPGEMSGTSFLPQLLSDRGGVVHESRSQVYMYRERHAWCCHGGSTFPSRAVRTRDYLLIWNAAPEVAPSDVDGGPTRRVLTEGRSADAALYELTFGKRPELELYDVGADPYQMNNLIDGPGHRVLADSLREDLFGYLRERGDPRMNGDEDVFTDTPYFGHLFELGMLDWAVDRDGRRFSEQAIANLLDRAYAEKEEGEAFSRVARSEGWTRD